MASKKKIMNIETENNDDDDDDEKFTIKDWLKKN